MTPTRFFLLAVPLVLSLHAASAKNETYTDPEKADADFKIQGEFTGEKIGAQVIALGEHKFQAVFYAGGLPGAGWDEKTRDRSEGVTEGEQVVFKATGKGYAATLSKDQLSASDDTGKKIELKRIARKSPTLGAAAPKDAIVLFDGKNSDAWEGGHMDERNLLAAGAKTKQKFQSFTAHVEFCLPFKPDARGQARGNSGVYLQNRYEVQVLDSFGLKGENNECGGIYTQAAPKVNMCFPPLTWQTYDIDFTAAQFGSDGKKTKNAIVTVKHNGVVIHQDQEIKGSTGGGMPESVEPGPLFLQGHGNPVFYKNIWVVEKK